MSYREKNRDLHVLGHSAHPLVQMHHQTHDLEHPQKMGTGRRREGGYSVAVLEFGGWFVQLGDCRWMSVGQRQEEPFLPRTQRR